ncbi:hypothetical protein HZS_2503, partial [Henneguya salminicola]
MTFGVIVAILLFIEECKNDICGEPNVVWNIQNEKEENVFIPNSLLIHLTISLTCKNKDYQPSQLQLKFGNRAINLAKQLKGADTYMASILMKEKEYFAESSYDLKLLDSDKMVAEFTHFPSKKWIGLPTIPNIDALI